MKKTEQVKYLIYSPPAAGSLKYILGKKNLKNQKVVSIDDDLSYGPLDDTNKRISFFSKVINSISPVDEELKEYIEFRIKSWPKPDDFIDCKIIILHSKNAPEQLMLKMITKQLQNLDLYEIAIDNEILQLRGTGAFTPEQLGTLIGTEQIISNKRKNMLIKEWDNLLLSEDILREWRDKSIVTKNETYYDNLLISQCHKDYVNAASIVGMVLGNNKQMVSDTWLNYRIIQLIEKKKILAKGDTKHLRTFEVCLP
jgi:hypothetical protein